MTEPLLRGEERNTLRRHNGKLAIKSENCCKKCSDNPVDEPPCDIFTRASACYTVLDSNCNREIVPYIYMCAKSYVGETKPTNPDYRTPAGITFHHANGHCYTTTGEYFTEAELPFPHPPVETMAVALQLDALPEGCRTVICGTAPSQCGCLCYNYGTRNHCLDELPNPFTSFCCAGKVDANGNICFDFNYTTDTKTYIAYRCNRAGCQNLTDRFGNNNIGQACAAGTQCLMSHGQTRTVNPEGYSLCEGGCCRSKKKQVRTVVNLNEFCVDNSDPAQQQWVDAGFTDSFCIPAAIGACSVSFYLFGPSGGDGCKAENKRTITTNYSCGQTTVFLKEEYFGKDASICPDGVSGDESGHCCYCEVAQVYEDTLNISYNMPNSGDIECGLCRAELQAVWQQSQPGGSGFADDALSRFLFS